MNFGSRHRMNGPMADGISSAMGYLPSLVRGLRRFKLQKHRINHGVDRRVCRPPTRTLHRGFHRGLRKGVVVWACVAGEWSVGLNGSARHRLSFDFPPRGGLGFNFP